MVSDFVKIGTKLDIMPDEVTSNGNEEFNAVFHSKVQDIFPNGDLEVDMPTVNGKLILLHNSVRYRLICYSEKATYVARIQVVDRYKSNNMFLLRIRILTQFEKFQRREYFRCECTLDVKYKTITEEEIQRMAVIQEKGETDVYPLEFSTMYSDGVALDISGGGIRFTSRQQVTVNDFVEVVFSLKMDESCHEFKVVGKVLSSNEMKGGSRRFENRVQFTHIRNEEREVIIRYIFEQERKLRKLAGGR